MGEWTEICDLITSIDSKNDSVSVETRFSNQLCQTHNSKPTEKKEVILITFNHGFNYQAIVVEDNAQIYWV